MKPNGLGVAVFAFLLTMVPGRASAQLLPAADPDPTAANLVQLRDAFVRQVTLAGVACPFPPPKITLDMTHQWGAYDDATNTLWSPLWLQLPDADTQRFQDLGGPDAGAGAGRRMFEGIIHRWVFIHEMGHWSQACQKQLKGRKPYTVEYGADRVALAYWRSEDPAFVERIMGLFRHIAAGPSPVPAGESVEKFFNSNFEKLAMTPAYNWFQAQMVDRAYGERPAPSLTRALSLGGTSP
jgi:hypothetical protein